MDLKSIEAGLENVFAKATPVVAAAQTEVAAVQAVSSAPTVAAKAIAVGAAAQGALAFGSKLGISSSAITEIQGALNEYESLLSVFAGFGL